MSDWSQSHNALTLLNLTRKTAMRLLCFTLIPQSLVGFLKLVQFSKHLKILFGSKNGEEKKGEKQGERNI